MKCIIAAILLIQVILQVNCRSYPFNTVKNSVIRGDTNGLQNMIGDGADVNMVGPTCNKSLLTWAAMTGQTGTTRMLLEKGANPNIVDRGSHMTPLMHAADRKQIEIVKILMSFDADKEMKDSRGRTAKSIAQENNFIDDMHHSVAQYPDVRIALIGQSRLHNAESQTVEELIKLSPYSQPQTKESARTLMSAH